MDLPVGLFSIVNCEDAENLFLWINDIEDPKPPNSIAPGFRGVALELFDIVAPEGLCPELGIDKRVQFSPQEGTIARRQLVEALQEFIGFEYLKFRQIVPAGPLHRGGRF